MASIEIKSLGKEAVDEKNTTFAVSFLLPRVWYAEDAGNAVMKTMKQVVSTCVQISDSLSTWRPLPVDALELCKSFEKQLDHVQWSESSIASATAALHELQSIIREITSQESHVQDWKVKVNSILTDVQKDQVRDRFKQKYPELPLVISH